MATSNAIAHADNSAVQDGEQTRMAKIALELLNLVDDDKDDTTDCGSQATSGDEGTSSSSSGIECGTNTSVGKRCRFGVTPLETVPATPTAGSAVELQSPPGISRCALRRERDSVGCVGRPCRFGVNSLATMPSTPKLVSGSVVSPSKRVMRHAFEARMREERDAHRASGKVLPIQPTSSSPPSVDDAAILTRGPCGYPMTPPHRAERRRVAREALIGKTRKAGLPLKVHTATVAMESADDRGCVDPTMPAKKPLALEFALAPAPHWSSDAPLKKADDRGCVDPPMPAKKPLALEFALAPAPHLSSETPLKKAISTLVLGYGTRTDAAPAPR